MPPSLIIGGGFYGARLALLLRARGRAVTLIDREPTLLARASKRNQARVHGGYHYPRSILTSLRSRRNYARFVDEYADCVDRSFPHYYAVGRRMSKITAAQFVEFCRRIDAPLTPAPPRVATLFDSSRVEAVFQVEECAFDATKLRDRLALELLLAGVDVQLNTEAVRVMSHADGLTVLLHRDGDEWPVDAELVLNCTYSRLNHLLAASGADRIPVKHELTELALVEPPDALAGAAVTVIDGPFFSLMPYASRGLSTLSHVRYTPHTTWRDDAGTPPLDPSAMLARASTHFMHMCRDAERYLPSMRHTRYVDSLFEVKTIMPRSEQDDSRPILLRRSATLPGLITVLGAKIDSVYDVEAEIEPVFKTLGPATHSAHARSLRAASPSL